MLKLTLFEYLTRTLPECFILILAVNVLCGIRIEKNKYVLASILLSIFEYLVRQLPINYGVHTIINICTMIVIIKVFYNIDMLINIKAIMLCTIFMFICEALDMLLLNLVFGDKVQTLMNNYVTKIICGTPSLIFYLIIIWGVYIVKKRKKNEGC